MDALIMAAGRGSRLAAFTEDRPKALVDLGGISPLELQLDLLVNRGIRRAIIVVGYRGPLVAGAAQARVGDRMEIETVHNPFWPVANVISSAWLARSLLQGAFLYLHADTVFEPSILDDLLGSDAPAALPVDFRACEPEQMKAQVRGDRIVRLSKELGPSESAGEFIGIGVFSDEAVEPIRRGTESVMEAGDLGAYFESAVNNAIEAGLEVRAIPTAGRSWTEIDFDEDLATARRLLGRFREDG